MGSLALAGTGRGWADLARKDPPQEASTSTAHAEKRAFRPAYLYADLDVANGGGDRASSPCNSNYRAPNAEYFASPRLYEYAVRRTPIIQFWISSALGGYQQPVILVTGRRQEQ